MKKNILFFEILLYTLTIAFMYRLFMQGRITVNYEIYSSGFEHFPEYFIILRYIASNLVRLTGFGLCIGMLFKKPLARHGMIYYAAFGMAIAFIKHPYSNLVMHVEYLGEIYPNYWFYLQHWLPVDATPKQTTWGWIFIFGFKTFIVHLVVFLFLIIPGVKELFQSKKNVNTETC